MEHDHCHLPPSHHRAFAWGIALNIAFVAAEATFGVLADSVALLADAGHNLSDVLGLMLAWGAAYLSRMQPSERRTYGWRSTTIMAALINAIVLLLAIGGIAWESIRRFWNPAPVAGQTILLVAAIGVAINTLTALMFMAGRKQDLNIRGAFLHMAADAGVSAGVVVAGLVILSTGWVWVDPAVSLMIAAIVLIGTWGLLRESTHLVLQGVPAGIDAGAVNRYLASLPGVAGVHDLHIWAMSTNETALTAHLVKPEPNGDDAVIDRAGKVLHDRFGIHHVTLQLERDHLSLQCGDTCFPSTHSPKASGDTPAV